MRRRDFLGAAAVLAGCSVGGMRTQPQRPIVFVPGNNEDACLFTTLIWCFESQGYPRHLLHPMSYRNPAARSVSGGDDLTAHPYRSSTAEAAEDLQTHILQLKRDGVAADAGLVLIGHSRGGTVIRNRLRLHGADDTAIAVLCGTPNHGIVAFKDRALHNEFNALGEFMTRLNAVPLTQYPTTRFLTVRSRDSDVFFQPDGRFIGQPGVPTNVTASSPMLDGATNLEFPGIDHIETLLAPMSFSAMHEFILGHAPRTMDIVPENSVEFSGRFLDRDAAGYLINAVPRDATLTIWRIDPRDGQRIGRPLFDASPRSDGAFGPCRTSSADALEFILQCAVRPTTHIYRTPLRRSTRHLRLRPMTPAASLADGEIVVVHRSGGYIGEMRDAVSINDAVLKPLGFGVNRFAPLAGQSIPSTVARTAALKATPGSLINARLNRQTLKFRVPAATGLPRILVAEFE